MATEPRPNSGKPTLRIAVVNSARNYGGQEAMAVLLAGALRERGHDVLFLCRPVFPALERVQGMVTVAPVLTGVDWDPLGIWRSWRAFRRHGSDVVLVTTNKDMRSAAIAAAWARIPVVVSRGMARPFPDKTRYRFLYGRLSAHLIANSRATQEIALESGPWLHRARTSVVHNGVDPEPFRSANPAEVGVPKGALTIGFVGRFVEWKGVMTLAEAWPTVARELPDAHLVLVGEGEMEGEMRDRLRNVDRVHWLGFRRDIPGVMQSLDILAFPSKMEGFGLAALEAMAAGVPVVAARACALPELIDDGRHGFLVTPDEPSELAEALIRLGKDEALRRAMGERGAERVDRDFSLTAMMDAYEERLIAVARRGVADRR